MDKHFSTEIAKYTKSNNILVGFNLHQPLELNQSFYKKAIGTVLSHAEPTVKENEAYIASFEVVLNFNKEAYKRSQSEAEKRKYISTIHTENIESYELATIKAAEPKLQRRMLMNL